MLESQLSLQQLEKIVHLLMQPMQQLQKAMQPLQQVMLQPQKAMLLLTVLHKLLVVLEQFKTIQIKLSDYVVL